MNDATPVPWATDSEHREALVMGAEALKQADVIVIGAGAGMSVDSGIAPYRGPDGVYQITAPSLEEPIPYDDLITGPRFERDPALAWGFLIHVARMTARATPHTGYEILLDWTKRKRDAWVYTSNVDRLFVRAGFDPARLTEIHGSRQRLQCSKPCRRETWDAGNLAALAYDPDSMLLLEEPPRCPWCGALARPNTLLFDDARWVNEPTRARENALTDWLQAQLGRRVVVLEIGAGPTVPNVRFQCERYARGFGATLVRINPGHPQGPAGTISIPLGARDALVRLAALMA